MGCLVAVFASIVGSFFFGPLGIFIGPIVYFYFFKGSSNGTRSHSTFSGWTQRAQNGVNPLVQNYMVLIAAIIEADGRVLRSELDHVRTFLRNSLASDEEVRAALIYLRDLLANGYDVDAACLFFQRFVAHGQRVSIVRFLLTLAHSDGIVTPEEETMLRRIARLLGVAENEYRRVQARTPPPEDYYSVLGVPRSASNDEIRNAYRRLTLQWHPDRMHDRSDAEKEAATKKLQAINEAYDAIRKARGMH